MKMVAIPIYLVLAIVSINCFTEEITVTPLENFILPIDLEESACYTSKKESGTCINIKKCPYMIQLLVTHRTDPKTLEYLRGSTCGFDGNDPMVCCPQLDKVDAGDRNNMNNGQNNPILPTKPTCGLSNVTNSRVVGGVPASLNEFPFMVILGYRNLQNPIIPKWRCGGTLITEKHVLTAAHCCKSDLYLARVGEYILFDETDGATPEDIPITSVKMHENFSDVQFTNDIAILKLSKKPNNPLVWPICLPIENSLRSNSFVGQNGVVAGWGSIYYDGPRSSILLVADLPVLSESTCQQVFGSATVIDNRIICAGYVTGFKDTCKGDSGGPLMYAEKNGKILTYYQIGIISYGYKCAEKGYPGVFTKVTKFLEWIQKNVV